MMDMSECCYWDEHGDCATEACGCDCHEDQEYRALSGWQPCHDHDDTRTRDADWDLEVTT